ncbi:hypothetical protein NFI00_000132 [Salmonella enterica]|nr:hypothetical protein [Salmonella enterica]
MPYIVIEGVDFSGKSTLASALKTQLKLQYGVESVIVEEPSTHNDRCKEIRHEVTTNPDLTNEERAALFLEQRQLVIQDLVLPALTAGKLVIGSRSFVSTMVYQTPENGFGMHSVLNANLDGLEAFGDDAIPDLGILCEITHETFLKRCKGRNGYMDELEIPLLDPVKFKTRCEKYLKAMVYTKTALKKFDSASYTGDLDMLLAELARKFKYEKLPEEGEVSSLTPPPAEPEVKGVASYLVP